MSPPSCLNANKIVLQTPALISGVTDGTLYLTTEAVVYVREDWPWRASYKGPICIPLRDISSCHSDSVLGAWWQLTIKSVNAEYTFGLHYGIPLPFGIAWGRLHQRWVEEI